MNGWTLDRRKRQSIIIRAWKPWEQSTGPVTENGKAEVSKNAYKGAVRPSLRKVAKVLVAHSRYLKEFDMKP